MPVGEERTQHSCFRGFDRFAEVGESSQEHAVQHFPVEVGGPLDPFIGRDGRIAGDGCRFGDPFGLLVDIVAGGGFQDRFRGADGCISCICRKGRPFVRRQQFAGDNDRPHGSLFGIAQFDEVDVDSGSQLLGQANCRLDRLLALSRIGMLRVEPKQGGHSPSAPRSKRQQRQQRKLFQLGGRLDDGHYGT